jgi:hypothetical protein
VYSRLPRSHPLQPELHARALQGLLGDSRRRRSVRSHDAGRHASRHRVRHTAAHDRRRLAADNHHRRLGVDRAAPRARNDPHRTAGGPWEKLAAFEGTRQPTEFRPIDFVDEGATKRATIAGRLKTVVQRIRGRDKSKPVLFENCFNQIHAPTQVIALGESEYDDGVVSFRTTGSHGLFSQFEWTVSATPLSTARDARARWVRRARPDSGR